MKIVFLEVKTTKQFENICLLPTSPWLKKKHNTVTKPPKRLPLEKNIRKCNSSNRNQVNPNKTPK